MKLPNYYSFFLIATFFLLTSCGSSNREKAFQSIEQGTVDSSSSKPQINIACVKIGNQYWAKNNLNIDHFRNGDVISEARSDEEWENAGAEGKPAWCYYNNDSSFGEKYGKLYNYYAVRDSRGIAPAGLHVATDEEWTALSNSLGGEDIAGIKLFIIMSISYI